jgi:hypothetical protein
MERNMNIDNPTDLPPGSRKSWRQLVEGVRSLEAKIERLINNSTAGGSGSAYYTQSQVDEMLAQFDRRVRKLEPEPGPELGYRPSKW